MLEKTADFDIFSRLKNLRGILYFPVVTSVKFKPNAFAKKAE